MEGQGEQRMESSETWGEMMQPSREMGFGLSIALRGGSIWGHPHRDAVVLRGGKIAWIGPSDELDCPAEETIDVRGGVVAPGFVDAHVHLAQTGLADIGWHVDLAGRSRAEAIAAVRGAARGRGAGEWVVATGWDESRWPEAEALTRRELDRVAPRNPVLAVRVDGHVLVANSPALQGAPVAAILAARAGAVGRNAGRVCEEAAMAAVAAVQPDRSTIHEAIRAAARLCHRLGIVSAHTMCDGLEPELFLEAAEAIALRLVVNPPIELLGRLAATGRKTGVGNDWATWGGVKLFLDGSIGARNAAVSEAYRSGGRGALLWDDAGVAALIRAADAAGWQTIAHAIGDRAIEQLVTAHEAVGTCAALRHRVEHFELASKEQIARAEEAGLCACMQPNFVGNWSGAGSLYERELGSARDRRSDPHRWVVDAGMALGFGSDGMPISPLYGLGCAVRAPHAAQRLSVEEAVDAYTAGGAFLAHDEADAGTIDVGKRADVVVLETAMDDAASEIGRWTVEWTFVDGKCVYHRVVT
ncbi:MAG: amidohydrolase [Candidatus Bipolaricaulis sp.]|nr:amidohydrolase [Candidatus Bipolaricaulis sp.]